MDEMFNVVSIKRDVNKIKATPSVRVNFPDVEMGAMGNAVCLPTPNNVEALLEAYEIGIKFNELKNERFFTMKGVERSYHDQENSNLNNIWAYCRLSRLKISDCKLNSYLTQIASYSYNLFNPFEDWVMGFNACSDEEFNDFLSTIEGKNKSVDDMLIKTWLSSAVKAAMTREGLKAEGVLVFAGDQGIGKTTWFQSLFPRELDLVLDGFILDTKSVDSIRDASSFLVVELGEVDASFKKSNIESIKSYLSRRFDKFRLPYSINSQTVPRRTVFGASVNNSEFLVDSTGNRRFWVIDVSKINPINPDTLGSVWRYIFDKVMGGEWRWYLTADELALLEKTNRLHQAVLPSLDLTLSSFDFGDSGTYMPAQYMSTSQILKSISIPINRSEATKLGLALTKMGVPKIRKRNSTVYLMPRYIPETLCPNSGVINKHEAKAIQIST